VFAVAKSEAAKTIPLGFILPLRPGGKLGRRTGFHDWIILLEREAHRFAKRFVSANAAFLMQFSEETARVIRNSGDLGLQCQRSRMKIKIKMREGEENGAKGN
jgi:hypothetical protein